jgi:hypothetical protein
VSSGWEPGQKQALWSMVIKVKRNLDYQFSATFLIHEFVGLVQDWIAVADRNVVVVLPSCIESFDFGQIAIDSHEKLAELKDV